MKTASENKQALGVSTVKASASTNAEAPMEVDNRDEGGDEWIQRNARLDDQIAVSPG